jgi:hypothetical protein
MVGKSPNEALHLTAFPLRSKAAGELVVRSKNVGWCVIEDIVAMV